MSNNKQQKQSIDDFYKNKIEEGKIDFDSIAWEAMENKLDDSASKVNVSEIISLWKSMWIPTLSFLFILATSILLFTFFNNTKTHSSDLNNTESVSDELLGLNNGQVKSINKETLTNTTDNQNTESDLTGNNGLEKNQNQGVKDEFSSSQNSHEFSNGQLRNNDLQSTNQNDIGNVTSRENQKSRSSLDENETDRKTLDENNRKSANQKSSEGNRNDENKNDYDNGQVKSGELVGELSDTGAESTPEYSEKDKKSINDNHSKNIEAELAKGGGISDLKNGRTTNIDANLSTANENNSNNSTQEKMVGQDEIIDGENSTNTKDDVSIDANTDSSTNKETSLNQNEENQRVENDNNTKDNVEDLLNQDVGPISNSEELADSENSKIIEFPYLPFSQFNLEQMNATAIEGDYLTPKEIKVLRNTVRKLYVKVGYLDYEIMGIRDKTTNAMISLGYDLKNTKRGYIFGELAYERFRNEKHVDILFNNLNIQGGLTRNFIDLRGAIRWRPINNRFSFTTLLGLGLETASWDVKSSLYNPFDFSVLVAENSNVIHLKSSLFVSNGLDLGYDIIRNKLSFHLSINYHYRINDVEVNGINDGYKINPSEFEEAYEIFDSRILEKSNHLSMFLGLKYYIH